MSRTQVPLPIIDAQRALVMSRTQVPLPIIDAQATHKEGPSRLPTEPGDDLA